MTRWGVCLSCACSQNSKRARQPHQGSASAVEAGRGQRAGCLSLAAFSRTPRGGAGEGVAVAALLRQVGILAICWHAAQPAGQAA